MAELIYLPRALDENGDVVSDATAYFYEDGTSTPLTVYTDSGLGTPRGTSLAADSEGVFAQCWVANGTGVKVHIQDGAGVAIPGWDNFDNAGRFPEGGADLDNTVFDPVTGNTATDGQEAIANNTARINNLDQKQFIKTATGSSGNFSISAQYTIAAYAEGQAFTFIANAAGGGSASTLNVDGVGSLAIKIYDTGSSGKRDASSFDIAAYDLVTVTHDGSHWVMMEPGRVATTAARGEVEIATASELAAGTTNKVPEADTINAFVGLHYIESQDASNSASLNFTDFDATLYDAYMFILSNVQGPDGSTLRLRTSTDGGSTWDQAASDYEYAAEGRSASGGTPTWESTGATHIQLTGTVGAAGGEHGASGKVEIFGPHLALITHTSFRLSYHNDSGVFTVATGAGTRDVSADVDACQFFFNSGNISSGTITMYGFKS